MIILFFFLTSFFWEGGGVRKKFRFMRGGQGKNIRLRGGVIICYRDYLPNPTSPPYPIKNERSLRPTTSKKKERNFYAVIFFPAAKCKFDGSYPNDTVFCKEYVENYTCTNTKECCQIPNSPDEGCFNMSVIQGKKM